MKFVFLIAFIGILGALAAAGLFMLRNGKSQQRGPNMARALAVHTWPAAELFSIYVAMAIVLVFRPEGLFQRIQARKI